MLCGPNTTTPTLMFDSSGNGGFYRENGGVWALYYSPSNGSVGILSSTTASGIALYVNGIAQAVNDFRAPIFYDSNNTAYYGDFASTSNLNALTIANGITNSSSYVNVGQLGLYNSTYGGYFYESNATRWNSSFNGNGSGAITLSVTYEGSVKLWMYYDGSGSGMLTNTGNWGVRMNYDGGAAPGGTLYGPWIATTDLRAPIFYDSADTGYYLNLNGTSNFGTVITGIAQFQSNLGATSGSLASPPLQVFATGGNSAFMSFHRSGAYAINMGFDSDNILRIGGWSAPANLWQLDTGGNNTVLASSRAPIFYDSNDTTYYGDFASNSVLATATFNVNGSSIIYLTSAGTNASMIKAGPGDELYLGCNDTWQMRFSSGNALMDNGGYLQNNQSIRSPIFYDSDNTAYYLNPASRSNLYTFTMGDSNELNQLTTNVTTSSIIGLGFNGSDSNYAIFKSAGAWTQPLNIKFYVGIRLYSAIGYDYGTSFWDSVGGGLLMSVGQGDANVRVSNSIFAQLYYDSNNTAYYLDPNSTSTLNQAQFAGYLGLGGNGPTTNMSGTFGVSIYHATNPSVGFSSATAPNFLIYKSGAVLNVWNSSTNETAVFRTTYTEFAGSARSPLFYDLDNTAFFIEGNANSVLYRLQVRKASSFTTANDSQIELANAGSGSCYISYHREGAYGAHFGLSTDNRFSSYGWSAGAGYTGLDLGTIYILQNNGTDSVVFLTSRPGVADSFYLFASDSWGPNGASATMKIGNMSSTGRSINATGSINASGSDYAEYMTKAGDFIIAKGDICGVDVNGKLTNVYADAISFVVKSTKPSYVGGDEWGSEEGMGMVLPTEPIRMSEETDESLNARKAQYLIDKPIYEAALQVARAKVDRIAFSGQVPVNVTGAVSGQYIIPVDDNGAIKGIAVNEDDLTMSQYIKAVGKVIKVVNDRPTIIVKVS